MSHGCPHQNPGSTVALRGSAGRNDRQRNEGMLNTGGHDSSRGSIIDLVIVKVKRFFKKISHTQPLFQLFFESFSKQILQQINVTKGPSSIRCWNSNSQSSDYESPPITTKPGLPSYVGCTSNPT